MRSAGVEVDDGSARAEAAQRGMFVGRAGAIRVDVFVPSIPFYEVAATRRERTEIAGRPTWVHSAEVLAVFKMLFFRPKDLIDVERMLQVRGGAFDRAFVRDALLQMLEEDERIDRWDAICRSAVGVVADRSERAENFPSRGPSRTPAPGSCGASVGRCS